ncbi:MAG: sporulation integral membrane protein YtvI [Firmicutes bacterium]|nr:sporulation integral membrane protein YtvI [Bacillota bacterium]
MKKVPEFWRYLIIWGGVLTACYLAAKYVLPLFAPFIVAVILASIIDPIVVFTTKRSRFSRGVCAFICLLCVFILLSIIIAFIVIRIISEAQDLYRELPIYNMTVEEILGRVIFLMRSITEDMPDSVINAIKSVQSRLYWGLEKIILNLTGVIMSLPRLSINIIVSFFAAFFISRDKEEISEFFANLAPIKWRDKASKAKSELVSVILGFIRAYLILISVTIAVSVVGFTVAGVKYAWILGIIAGVLDLIPLVGPGLLYISLIIVYIITKQFYQAIVIAVLLIVQFFIRKGMEPRVLGGSLGIHPIAVLVSMYLGYRFLGAAGMFIGPFFAVMLKIMVKLNILPSWPKE